MNGPDKPAGRRSGTGTAMSDGGGHSITVPQHAIDVAIAQAAQAKLLRIIRAKGAEGVSDVSMRAARTSYNIAKFSCKALGRDASHTLSPNVRRILTHYLGKDAEAVIERAKDNAGVGSLADWAHDPSLLPKKPPGRK